MIEKEPLDYCRVKKISDKGYGFLTSLYYKEPVFFHFNRIKDPGIKEKLEKLKRGEVYLFFTSMLKNARRKVDKLWVDLKDVDIDLIPDFIDRLTEELSDGKINIFEIAHVIKLLREDNHINYRVLEAILFSNKMLKTPSLLKAILSDEELKNSGELNSLIEELESNKINSEFWVNSVLQIISRKDNPE